jgi:hypothetical protein
MWRKARYNVLNATSTLAVAQHLPGRLCAAAEPRPVYTVYDLLDAWSP